MKKTIYITAVVAFIAFATGCKKDFLSELGNNPNQPSEAPVQLLLPPVLTGLANYEAGLRTVAGITFNTALSSWMGYGSFASGYSIDDNTLTYYVSQGSPSNWGLYDILKNADYIEKTAAAAGDMNYYVAAAKILKAFGFQKLVDAYGKIPYSEAFEGVDNFFPSYDEPEGIYEDLLKQVDSAIAMIQEADVSKEKSMASNDILYAGDMDKWLKFANTVKLKLLMRQSNVLGSGVQSALSNTLSIGFITADANVNPGYLNTAGKQSPLWASWATSPGGSLYSDGYAYLRAGGAALNFLKDNNDPRLFYMFAPEADSNKKKHSPNTTEFFDIYPVPSAYKAIYYGDHDNAESDMSGIGPGILQSYKQSVALISASQSYFLQSEAALNSWIPGDAKELYQDGITESFKTLGVEDADTAAKHYYTQAIDLINWDNTTNKQKAIITQKWISMAYTHSFEAWCEYRRTGYPNLDVLPTSMFPNVTRHMPGIWWYPKSESDRNQDNYKAAGGGSTDPQTQKLFWAQ